MSDLHTQTKMTAQPKHFTSLRGFLAALDQMNDLQEVRREVDTDLEIGAIIRRTHETYAPAPLLTNIRGHAGYRVLGDLPRRPASDDIWLAAMTSAAAERSWTEYE